MTRMPERPIDLTGVVDLDQEHKLNKSARLEHELNLGSEKEPAHEIMIAIDARQEAGKGLHHRTASLLEKAGNFLKKLHAHLGETVVRKHEAQIKHLEAQMNKYDEEFHHHMADLKNHAVEATPSRSEKAVDEPEDMGEVTDDMIEEVKPPTPSKNMLKESRRETQKLAEKKRKQEAYELAQLRKEALAEHAKAMLEDPGTVREISEKELAAEEAAAERATMVAEQDVTAVREVADETPAQPTQKTRLPRKVKKALKKARGAQAAREKQVWTDDLVAKQKTEVPVARPTEQKTATATEAAEILERPAKVAKVEETPAQVAAAEQKSYKDFGTAKDSLKTRLKRLDFDADTINVAAGLYDIIYNANITNTDYFHGDQSPKQIVAGQLVILEARGVPHTILTEMQKFLAERSSSLAINETELVRARKRVAEGLAEEADEAEQASGRGREMMQHMDRAYNLAKWGKGKEMDAEVAFVAAAEAMLKAGGSLEYLQRIQPKFKPDFKYMPEERHVKIAEQRLAAKQSAETKNRSSLINKLFGIFGRRTA